MTLTTWWIFKMPECTVYVPATSEADARIRLRAHCYKGAPVDSWPFLGTRLRALGLP